MIAKAPIAILAFNRPDCLDQTLRSLATQSGESLADREIHLFQDGMLNEFSGHTYGTEEAALNNIALFRRLFPSGHVHRQERNQGVALHFDFIERYLFESRSFEAAIFLEDDLVLSPLYLTVIDRMIAASMSNEIIGCVAAYGNRRATLAEQMANPSMIVTMENRWAFGLTRRQWLRQKPFMDKYLAIVSTMDYALRDHDKIVDWFISTGYLPTVTSQDGAKDLAMYTSGAAKFMTYCCYGKYIGKLGVHCMEEIYESAGYANMQLCPIQADHFEWPHLAETAAYIDRQQTRFSANLGLVRELFPPYRNPDLSWKSHVECTPETLRPVSRAS
jgi:hypothetical protein